MLCNPSIRWCIVISGFFKMGNISISNKTKGPLSRLPSPNSIQSLLSNESHQTLQTTVFYGCYCTKAALEIQQPSSTKISTISIIIIIIIRSFYSKSYNASLCHNRWISDEWPEAADCAFWRIGHACSRSVLSWYTCLLWVILLLFTCIEWLFICVSECFIMLGITIS